MKTKKEALLLLLVLAFILPATAQDRLQDRDRLLTQDRITINAGRGGPGGGGETTTGSNLSYPANFWGTEPALGTIGAYTLTGQFSYGCLKPETIGTTTYSNTSCVNSDGTAQTPQECTSQTGKCYGYSIERAYWQKDANNKWVAGYSGSGSNMLPVDFIDWGDNLESKTWPVQVLRVETNTFSLTPAYSPTNNPQLRYQMWHVFGQGTNELWGVRTTDSDTPIPYDYNETLVDGTTIGWPYGVNVTPTARLNISKLETLPSTCPTNADGTNHSPFNNLSWDKANAQWTGAFYRSDMLYGAELNIKGSYVYGYNWNLRNEPVPANVGKAGWWRLTFYTTDDSVNFSDWAAPSGGNDTLSPPPEPNAAPPAENSQRMYVPQVDKTNQLTYLDICITGGKAGGAAGKGGGGGNH